jgi:FkbM family methyltransferase
MKFREGTWDQGIFYTVVVAKEYGKLPDLNNKTVLNIGGHIGSFEFLVLHSFPDVKKIYTFEPSRGNFEVLEQNMKEIDVFKKVTIFNEAVYLEGKTLKLDVPHDAAQNTGGLHVFAKYGQEVKSRSLDSFIKEYGKIDLLKIDCEGSEHGIFEDSLLFQDNIDYIVGESHIGDYIPALKDGSKPTHASLYKLLESKGYTVVETTNRGTITNFHAIKKGI